MTAQGEPNGAQPGMAVPLTAHSPLPAAAGQSKRGVNFREGPPTLKLRRDERGKGYLGRM